MADRMYVSTRKGLFAFDRAGSEWRRAAVSFLAENISLALFDGRTNTLYAAADHGHFGVKLHASTDGGATWKELPAPVHPPKAEGDPANDAWGKPIPLTTLRIWALTPANADRPGHLWCGTIPGALFLSTDGGQSWELNRPLWDHPLRKDWMGGGADHPGIHSIVVDPNDSNRVLVGVSTGGVWQTSDGGASWELTATGMRAEYMPPEKQYEPNMQDVHYLAQCKQAPQQLWAQHHNGIFKSVDYGRSWSEVTFANASTFGFAVAVHPHQTDTAWFVPAKKDEHRVPADAKFVVTRTSDGGASAEVLANGLPADAAYDIVYRHALAIDGTGRTLAFGSTTGNLYVTDDGGDSWRCLSNHLPPVHAVCFAAS